MNACQTFNALCPKWFAGTWAYFATVLTALTFTLVPFISLLLGYHPVTLTREVRALGSPFEGML